MKSVLVFNQNLSELIELTNSLSKSGYYPITMTDGYEWAKKLLRLIAFDLIVFCVSGLEEELLIDVKKLKEEYPEQKFVVLSAGLVPFVILSDEMEEQNEKIKEII